MFPLCSTFFLSPPPFLFREFNSENHQAGSPGDEDLANKVLTKFKEYGMNPWTDEHFVRVQDPPASGTNKITFKGTNFRPSGFLSYSPSGRVTVIYKQNKWSIFKTKIRREE